MITIEEGYDCLKGNDERDEPDQRYVLKIYTCGESFLRKAIEFSNKTLTRFNMVSRTELVLSALLHAFPNLETFKELALEELFTDKEQILDNLLLESTKFQQIVNALLEGFNLPLFEGTLKSLLQLKEHWAYISIKVKESDFVTAAKIILKDRLQHLFEPDLDFESSWY